MFIQIVSWFIYFGLSFLVQRWGWTEQGKAFLYIYTAVSIIILIAINASVLVVGKAYRIPRKDSRKFLNANLIAVALYASALLASWGATKIFNIDYYVAFQLLTLGSCLGTSKKN